MTSEEFGALFDRFRSSAFRMETLQAYRVAEDLTAIEAWRAGRARPEYSVRTSPWAARLATSSIAGRLWRRVRVVELPLTEYVQWETAAYIESAVLGEQIRILLRTSTFTDLTEDFWLFDADQPGQAVAVAMRYDADGRPGEHQLVTDPDTVAVFAQAATRAWDAATPLNEFLAATGGPRPSA